MRQKGWTFRKVLCSGCLLFLVIVGLILICGTATATSPGASVAAPTVVGNSYELAPGSNFFQGCVGSCMCPVQKVGQIEGTFELIPLRPTGLFTQYRLANLPQRSLKLTHLCSIILTHLESRLLRAQ